MTLVPGTVASSGGDSSDVDSTTYSQLSSDSGHGGGESEGGWSLQPTPAGETGETPAR